MTDFDALNKAIADYAKHGFNAGFDTPKPLTVEDFRAAVKKISEDTAIKPYTRLYSPVEFAHLREHAEAFGIDLTDLNWDLLVYEEFSAYYRFTDYLKSVGWRP